MLNNHFRLVGRVWGKPQKKMMVNSQGQLIRCITFVLCYLYGKHTNLIPLMISEKIYDRANMFVQNGNIIAVEGIIISLQPEDINSIKSHKQIYVMHKVTDLVLLEKSKNKRPPLKQLKELLNEYDWEKLKK